jgi:manganese transport protein
MEIKTLTKPFNKSTDASLQESYRSIQVPKGASTLRKFLAFAGPGFLVAVGYMDPGNWATDLAGGSKFGYMLLSVILLSNFTAIFLQALSAKLGIATGRDLAQACRDNFSPRVSFVLWILAEIAIIATDLAEVIGSAIALHLLFGISLIVGVLITALDVLLVLFLNHKGFRYIETLVVSLIAIIAVCMLINVIWAQPDWGGVVNGFVPNVQILRDPSALYIALGILGATVMPHNLYLHSSIVQTRAYAQTQTGKREAVKFAVTDSTIALMFALLINASLLILSAAVFHRNGQHDVAEIEQAYELLSPMLGTSLASIFFAVALLCSGQNSTLTGTLAGQIVMEGFINLRITPWLRRLITRLLAIVPAVIVISLFGESSTTSMLVLSQVILSLQLSFAVFPLIIFTSNKKLMGEFVNARTTKIVGFAVATAIALLNAYLLYQTIFNA